MAMAATVPAFPAATTTPMAMPSCWGLNQALMSLALLELSITPATPISTVTRSRTMYPGAKAREIAPMVVIRRPANTVFFTPKRSPRVPDRKLINTPTSMGAVAMVE